MQSIGFPKMFKGNSTIVVTDDIVNEKATKSCLNLLLKTEKGELSGDPEFGITLKKYTFNQNSYVLRDILIDELYTQICAFCPQIFLERKNITIESDHHTIYAKITYKNRNNFKTNMVSLELMKEDE